MLTTTRTVRLSRKQSEFRQSRARYRGFVGGRGAGKSWVGAYDMLRRMQPGASYLIGSPTGVLMQDTTYPTFKQLAQELGVWGGAKLTPYPTATILLVDAAGRAGTAEARFRTAEDPERMRGPNLRGAWLDEASLMHADVRKIVYGALRDSGRMGWLAATFTPKGTSHWTYEAFASGLPNTAMVRAKTRENPFNHPDFEKTLFEQYGDTLFARQELAGEFVSLEGAEFPADWLAGADLWFDAWPTSGVQWAVQSLDPSKGSDGLGKDYQAHCQLAACIEGGRWVYYVDADLQREGVVPMVERAVRWAQTMHRTTNRPVDSLIVEDNATMGLLPAQLEATCARLNYAANWTVRTATENKNQRIMAWVGPPLSRRQLRFRRTAGSKLLMGQLASWPGDEFDDAPDALALALKRVTELMQGPG